MTKAYVKIGVSIDEILNISTSYTVDTTVEIILDNDIVDFSKLQGYVGYIGKDGKKHLKFDENKYNEYISNQKNQESIKEAEQIRKDLAEAMVLNNANDTQAYAMRYLYPTWNGNGIAYKKDERLMYEDKFYKVLQDHTSQADWLPSTASSLYVEIANPSVEYSEFKQPTGAHDAYAKGDKVTFKGKKYISLIDANVYSPTDYPTGWSLVE